MLYEVITAAHNMIEGSRLLKEMMEDFRSPVEQAKRIKDVEHIGDGITHDIARRLNQTFITPIDREDIHDLASALDDILDLTVITSYSIHYTKLYECFMGHYPRLCAPRVALQNQSDRGLRCRYRFHCHGCCVVTTVSVPDSRTACARSSYNFV